MESVHRHRDSKEISQASFNFFSKQGPSGHSAIRPVQTSVWECAAYFGLMHTGGGSDG
jgi:hypothetical protein